MFARRQIGAFDGRGAKRAVLVQNHLAAVAQGQAAGAGDVVHDFNLRRSVGESGGGDDRHGRQRVNGDVPIAQRSDSAALQPAGLHNPLAGEAVEGAGHFLRHRQPGLAYDQAAGAGQLRLNVKTTKLQYCARALVSRGNQGRSCYPDFPADGENSVIAGVQGATI